MAADSWTITNGDRDTIEVAIVIADMPYVHRVAISQIASGTQAGALTKLRALLVAYRDAVLARKAIPAAVANAIGYTEDF